MKALAAWSLVVAGLVVGCGGSPPPDDPEPVEITAPVASDDAVDPAAPDPVAQPADPPAAATDGQSCTRSEDCPDGQMCAGPEGCDVEWTCQPARPCTRDLVTYCGCDGQEIQGSGSCPPSPYVQRGPC